MTAAAITRVALGFLVAPLIGFLVLASGMCAFLLDPFISCVWNFYPFVAAFGGALAVPTALLVGLPMFFAFRRRGWLAWWQVAIAGLLCGALGSLAVLALGAHVLQWLLYLAYSALVGFLSGLTFWLVGVYRNAL